MAQIHSTAIIDPSAELADDVVVGAYCVVGPDVEIGDRCVLNEHAIVVRGTRMGTGNQLHAGCIVGGDPQDRKYAGEPTLLRIGNNNHIREHVTIHRGTGSGGGETIIGSDNLLMVGCHIAHDCIVGNGTVIANQVMLAGHVKVEDGASIGGGAGVHHFATIGQLSFVGGLARISRDVPPFMIIEGHPAEARAVNAIGMLRSDFSQTDVDAMKEAFRLLFKHATPVAEALPELRNKYPDHGAIEQLCHAVEAAALGVHGRAREAHRPDNKWATPPSVAATKL
ncbi:MAG: acyl-ACP--UDP-N-acetylglucosamine O-acyltransferase [Phycisphaerales bacterium]|jgi:UDP-N-acetylglucosamine acyltransferase|nr:acyl-ACP--UDP-N-acetylglucosamine O-acyltransferase [Phycisphaerales bacterium]